MGSIIITCFILAISFFECSKAGKMKCLASPICADHRVPAYDILCPKTPLGKYHAYLVLSELKKKGHSITGKLNFNLEQQTRNDLNKNITIDMCFPPEGTLERSNYFLAIVTFAPGHDYTVGLCNLFVAENNSLREALEYMRINSETRSAFCDREKELLARIS